MLNNTVILIDFDGTITSEDTNDKLVEVFSNEDVERFMKENDEREMTYIQYMDKLFSKLKITEDEYLRFILNEIEISRGFTEFYEKAKNKNIPIAIISGGFSNGIIPFLKKHGINDAEIYANNLNFQGNNIYLDFHHNRASKCCHIGYCGNCKTLHVNNFRKRFANIIFIGDGITDEPVASLADTVFAKDGLMEYCKEHEIKAIPWNDFCDIENIVFK